MAKVLRLSCFGIPLLLIHVLRTLTQFEEAKVVTNILSTTEDLAKAKFPKIVLKNLYELRQVNIALIMFINILYRQSFVDSVVYPDFTHSDDLSWAVYKNFVSGYEVVKLSSLLKQ